MRPTRAQVLAAVEGQPDGLTTAAFARLLGTVPGAISSTLSKLAAYGTIEKVPLPGSAQRVIWRPHNQRPS